MQLSVVADSSAEAFDCVYDFIRRACYEDICS